MADVHTGQQLLLGILALQMDFINREQLIAATSVWLEDLPQSPSLELPSPQSQRSEDKTTGCASGSPVLRQIQVARV